MKIVRYDPPRPYARASQVGDLVFLAGQTGRDEHGVNTEGSIREQTRTAFGQIGENLASFGLGFEDLVRMDVFLANGEDGHTFSETMMEYLPEGSPPGAMVVVKGFSHPGILVEIECIAAVRR